jgi:hypothetical protein
MPKIERVFYCDCGTILITEKEAAECCSLPMEEAGWMETNK